MATRTVLQIPVDENIYSLYYTRYYQEKSRHHDLTHNDLMKILLGLR